MNIIQRNFFSLIRSGVFNSKETLEPMSAFKWTKVYQLAVMHDVVGPVWEGLQACKHQFFLSMTEKQWKEWEHTVNEAKQKPDPDEDEFLRADQLTNPILNHKLQTILDDEHSDVASRQLLLIIIRVARHILNEGVPISQLVALGRYIRKEREHIDFRMLQQWLKDIRFEQIAQLEGAMLIYLFDFEEIEIPFLKGKMSKNVEKVAQELTEFTNTRVQDFYFSQESGEIFVHTSNGSAMLGHIRRSVQYFRYFPSEIVTNFFKSFAHSLSHIEE